MSIKNKTKPNNFDLLTANEMAIILEIIAPIYKALEFDPITGTFICGGDVNFSLEINEIKILQMAGLKLALSLKTEVQKNLN